MFWGVESVIAPVAPDRVIWFAVPVSEVTPELVIVTFVVPENDMPVPEVRSEAMF